jgi:hypothetical protein
LELQVIFRNPEGLNNSAMITINHMEQKSIRKNEELPVYTAFSFISDVGGILGLFLGLSFWQLSVQLLTPIAKKIEQIFFKKIRPPKRTKKTVNKIDVEIGEGHRSRFLAGKTPTVVRTLPVNHINLRRVLTWPKALGSSHVCPLGKVEVPNRLYTTYVPAGVSRQDSGLFGLTSYSGHHWYTASAKESATATGLM